MDPVVVVLSNISAAEIAVSFGMVPERVTSVDVMRHKSEDVLRLKAEGKSVEHIAREAGVSRSTVTRIVRYVERASAG